MIQPLRTLHRRIFVTLALVVPAILVLGLRAQRKSAQAAVEMPMPIPGSAYVLRKSGTMWQRHTIESEFYSDSKTPEGIYVVLKPADGLSDPDLLLYWSSREPEGKSLPEGARLLGSFRPGPLGEETILAIPAEVERVGYLVLFSLAHREVIDRTKAEKLP